MKKIAKAIIVAILGWQVRRLRRKHQFSVIAVGGSIGKTSTKFAVARMLSQKYRVRFQEGNYNDLVSVPLVFFGWQMPSLFNPLAWLKIILKNEASIRKTYPFDVIVVELGTDGPGQLAAFGKYLKVDLGVVTAITPEHMEYFPSLDDVADEELAIGQLSSQLLINSDLCDKKYLSGLDKKYLTYAVGSPADYYLTDVVEKENGFNFTAKHAQEIILKAHHESVARSQLFSLCSAFAVGSEMGLDKTELSAGIKSIKAVDGRLQKLDGIKQSVIIDDTYNASPEAMKEALNTLYSHSAPQKIAVLGNMNELGDTSASAHRAIGEYCDPDQLDIVLTIGPDANKYLAGAAEKKGCVVKSFVSPYELGEYLKEIIKPKALILAKGSQNGVFAEEAVKLILANSKDGQKLVRQSPQWLKIKQKQFRGAGK